MGCDSGNLGSLSRVQLLLLDRPAPETLLSPFELEEEVSPRSDLTMQYDSAGKTSAILSMQKLKNQAVWKCKDLKCYEWREDGLVGSLGDCNINHGFNTTLHKHADTPVACSLLMIRGHWAKRGSSEPKNKLWLTPVISVKMFLNSLDRLCESEKVNSFWF